MTEVEYCDLNLSQIDSYARVSVNKVLRVTTREDNIQSIVLNDSVLYAEGGGQPYDLGTINGTSVVSVYKAAGSRSGVEVTLVKPIDVKVGDEVSCEVDWVRRYDFMQQHTAQHLFSALADKMFQADTVGWALGKDTVTVDLQTPTYALLTSSQLDDLERAVNLEIGKCTPVTWKVRKTSELESLGLLRGAPKGAAQGLEELRLIEIEGLDMNPCGGTHLKSIGEIQCLRILGAEKDRNALRVRWVAGDRAINYFKTCVDRDAQLTKQLLCPPESFVPTVEKLIKDKRDLTKSVSIISDELIGMIASSMISYLSISQSRCLVYHRATGDLNMLQSLAEVVSATFPNIVVYLSVADAANAVTSSEKKKGKGKDTVLASCIDYDKPYTLVGPISGSFVLYGSKETVETLKSNVYTAINGRGGGRPGRLQGTASNLEKIESIRQLANAL